jgi:tRNA dimethylallyltransferase
VTRERRRVFALLGATATGKTAVSEWAARRHDLDIVCADARQVFAELEIGSGKPTPAERAGAPHHLFDLLRLGARASAGGYARAAEQKLAKLLADGRRPLLVGGSGLYLKALMAGLAEEPPHDPELRARLQAEAEREGAGALHARLRDVDPEAAARLAPADIQRVSRALEVFEASGHTQTWWHARGPGRGLDVEWRLVELVEEPVALERRIAERTSAMFAGGLVDETRSLVEQGHGRALRALSAIGYDEALDVLDGRCERAEAEARTSLRTRQLAKRQRTWFRHQVEAERIRIAESAAEALGERAAAYWLT